ncbi:MAG: winged helix-turn-helix transcriptional regulator [Candidatus Lokiarchaeota archaeon]|nr:winged helix-turn-helix transcriptional regulator [Candidatus Lokiarchaeota archaeon]
MTEDNIRESPQEKLSKNEDEDQITESWGMLVTKSTVRLKIWQILQLFGELNVTQISNLLKESKSTASRHLNGMEEDGLVKSREDSACCPGRIAPKIYTINNDIYKVKSGIEMEQGYPKDFNKRIEYIQSEIQTNRASIEMITGIMRLLEPIYNEVEALIKEGSPESLVKADELFKEYMWGPNGENITWFQFRYQTPKMYFLERKIHEASYKILSDDFDSESFEGERLKLKAELEEAKKEQQDAAIPKKYGRFSIFMPLKKIFEKNQGK